MRVGPELYGTAAGPCAAVWLRLALRPEPRGTLESGPPQEQEQALALAPRKPFLPVATLNSWAPVMRRARYARTTEPPAKMLVPSGPHGELQVRHVQKPMPHCR